MAKLDSTSVLAGSRGRVGGVVVSSNRSGGYLRPWFMPRVPRTPDQQAWVAKWNSWIQIWKGLSDTDKGLWTTASALPVWTRTDWFGQLYQPNGMNLWLIVAAMRDAGLPIVTTPPSGSAPSGVFYAGIYLQGWTSPSPSGLAFSPASPSGVVYAQVEVSFYNGTWLNGQNKPYRPFWSGAYVAGVQIDVGAQIADLVGRVYGWTGVFFRWRGLSSTCVPQVWQTSQAHMP